MSQAMGLPPYLASQLSGDGPYPPKMWSLGATPNVSVDVPILAVFLFLYIAGAIANVAVYIRNKRNGHFFPFSLELVGVCILRTCTCCLRMAWASNHENIGLNLATEIFTTVGIILIYIVDMNFALRILRARHPIIGWHRGVYIAFGVTYIFIPICVAMFITTITQQFFTLSPNTLRIDRDVQLSTNAFFFAFSCLPIPIIAFALLLPRRVTADSKQLFDKFGTGRFRSQVAIALVGDSLIALGSGFRLGTFARDPVMMTQPLPWYFSRACYYCFNFMLEILVIYFYLATRVDQRFFVPNNSKEPGDYRRYVQDVKKERQEEDSL